MEHKLHHLEIKKKGNLKTLFSINSSTF